LEECGICYPNKDIAPLDWKTLDIEKEWYLDVPIEVQIFLESYINYGSVKRTKNIDTYMHTKLVRMYSIYDNLLNVYNKYHLGVVQQMNGTELMVNYRNIGHSFKLAQEMGMACGLNKTEHNWKRQATDDHVYFNTAIRRTPLEYESIEKGSGVHFVSLRMCYIWLVIDNLVTLTQRADPEPGTSRTGQLCTIQGTIMGIPKDAAYLLKFHEQEHLYIPTKLYSHKLVFQIIHQKQAFLAHRYAQGYMYVQGSMYCIYSETYKQQRKQG
jgi:hypothetical protein